MGENSMPNVCDLCNAFEPDDGFIFLSRDVRVAIRGGLDFATLLPVEPTAAARSAFLNLVSADDTDWKVCSRCAKELRTAIRAFWPAMRARHRAWLVRVETHVAALCWTGYEKAGRGFLELVLQQFADISGTLNHPSRYVSESSLSVDFPVADVRRMLREYQPESEAVVMFTYMSEDEEIATAHPLRFRPSVPPAAAADTLRPATRLPPR